MRARRPADAVRIDQISRPLLIVLAAAVALAAMWMLALKPKPVAVKDTPLAPTQAIGKARQAAAASDAANAAVQRAAADATGAAGAGSAASTAGTGAAAAKQAGPATPAATKPEAARTRGATTAKPKTAKTPGAAAAKSVGRPSAAIVHDIHAGKVVVILFWAGKSLDDIATIGALHNLDRHNGKVAVHIVRIGRAARYASIARGLPISHSPTTIVIDRQRRPRAINGLAEPRELRHAVRAAFARH